MSSWNSGRIIGQKPPLKPKEVWAIRTRLQMSGAVRDLRCSISRSTANCELVISSQFQLPMLRFPEGFATARSSSNGKQADQCSSN